MIGFSCPPLSVKPFHEAAARILPHFELWEIVSEGEHYLPDIEKQARELLETTHLKLSIHAPYSDINIAAFEESVRKFSVKTLCDVIDSAERLDIGPVTIHPGVIGPIQQYDIQKVRKLTRKSLEEIWTKTRFRKIAFENMPDIRSCICKTANEMEEMLNNLEIGMCLDMGHANTCNQMHEMLAMQNKFKNIHVHDNHGEKDEHLVLGRGNIDFNVLKNLNYKGNHIIEASTTDMKDALVSKRVLESIL